MIDKEDNINNDSRNPVSLHWGEGEAEDGYSSVIGQFKNCDVIESYYEHGQMEAVPWFRVIRNGVVIARVNAALVRQVCYA